jgi:thioesterase domain-containing protein/acyl carrier protein
VVLAVLSDEAPTYLVAYVVPDPRAATESVAALRRRLRERLPEYMVPAVIVPMTALPRNERGKVERRSLPAAPERASGEPPATQWEKVVADLWGEVLGLDEIHLDDDFMALGADSLTAEEMLAQAGDRFSVSLVTSDLLEAPTLREFSHRVSLGSASLPSHPDVVSLGGRGTATPVFCFAGGGALALGFAPIARHFGDRPVYAFQSHGLERRALPDRTVEAAADRALALMRVIQPSGPYLVVGHSFGGLVALEVARRLTDAGQEVALVGLLDTFLLTGLTAQDASAAAQVAQGAMVPQRLDTPPGRLSGGIQVLDGLLRRVLPDGVPQLPEWGRHARSKVAGVVTFAGQRQFDAHFDHTVKVARRHQPKPYDGAVLLITAENNPQGAETWAPVLTGPLEVRDMPCEHSSMIREPHAAQVAAHLAEQIDALGL